MTRLTSPVRRITKAKYGKNSIVVTLASAGVTADAFVVFRLLGKRTQYITTVSTLYRLAALWHGQKVTISKRAARKEGVSWRVAKKQFERDNRVLETTNKKERK
jgi:hypothetical protein